MFCIKEVAQSLFQGEDFSLQVILFGVYLCTLEVVVTTSLSSFAPISKFARLWVAFFTDSFVTFPQTVFLGMSEPTCIGVLAESSIVELAGFGCHFGCVHFSEI